MAVSGKSMYALYKQNILFHFYRTFLDLVCQLLHNAVCWARQIIQKYTSCRSLKKRCVNFFSAISSRKLIMLIKQPSRVCFSQYSVLSTHFSTETMRIKCLAQGYNILMQTGFEPSIVVSRNRHLTHMINMRLNRIYK